MSIQNKFTRKDFRYLFFLSLFVLAVGICSTFFVYQKVRDSIEDSILTRTNTIAQFIDLEKLKNIKGDESDLSNTDYLYIKNKFQNAIVYNTDARFLYLMGQKDNQVFFFLDSEPDTSLDYSPPGQIYEEADPDIFTVFSSKQSLVQNVYEDRWGTWLTSLTPVIDPTSGEVLAVLGIDINADQFTRTLLIYSSIPFLITCLLLFLILLYYLFHKKEAERMLQKSELVSLASHEIRSPLNGIRFSLESLIKNSSKNIEDQTHKTLELIKDTCDQVLLTVNDLLDLSLVEKIELKKAAFEDIEVTDILSELIRNSRLSTLEKSVSVTLDPSVLVPIHIWGDREKIKRMFSNIISNAVKYSNTNSVVQIGCDFENENYIFWVKDDGIGIPEGEQKKVFAGFYRANNARANTKQGTGLGLYYVLEVVKLHKGKIWFVSKENQGTTFFIKLAQLKIGKNT